MKQKKETKREISNRRLKELHRMLWNHSKIFKTTEFKMDTWGIGKNIKKVKKRLWEDKPILPSCALGSAALHKPFVGEGLRMGLLRHHQRIIEGQCTIFPSINGSEFGDEYTAGAEFFGIPVVESTYLFNPAYYDSPSLKITPRMVAKRVKEILEKRGV